MDYESIARRAVLGATSTGDAERRISKALSTPLVWVQSGFDGKLFSVLLKPTPGVSNMIFTCRPW